MAISGQHGLRLFLVLVLSPCSEFSGSVLYGAVFIRGKLISTKTERLARVDSLEQL